MTTPAPYTTAELRQLSAWAAERNDGRLYATILALQTNVADAFERQHARITALEAALRPNADVHEGYARSIETLEARLAGLAASVERIIQAVPQAGVAPAQGSRWLWRECHGCGTPSPQAQECAHCGDSFCPHHQASHERECLPPEYAPMRGRGAE